MEERKTKIACYVSSVTGNTRKVMNRIYKDLLLNKKECGDVSMEIEQYESRDFFLLQDYPQADLHILGFWCRRGSMDDFSLNLLDQMKNQNILLVGTMGDYPESPYGKRVLQRVTDLVKRDNILIGCYLCQGKIEESRTEKRRNLPRNSPHYLNDRGYERHLASRSHPDENDLKNASEYVVSVLNSLNKDQGGNKEC